MKQLIYVFVFLLANILIAQELPNTTSFFPSAIGNIWEYETDHGFTRQVINGDSISPTGSLYLFSVIGANPDFEIDTLSFVHYLPFSTNWSIYKLNAEVGEIWRVQSNPPCTLARVDSIYTAFLWGEERNVKRIGFYRPPFPYQDTTITDEAVYERYVLLVSGIGEYYEYDFEGGPQKLLLGCKINGITYGTVDVEEEIKNIPLEIVLSQNYPNPFNPTTTIEYNLPTSGRVALKIYNILGEEVQTLMDDYQHQGNHRIIFDSQSIAGGLSSGIYVYTLTTATKSYAKKMILSK